MRGTPHVWGELADKESRATEVEFCIECHCPVVVAPGAMDRHVARVHVPPAAAKAGVNVQRWAREW